MSSIDGVCEMVEAIQRTFEGDEIGDRSVGQVKRRKFNGDRRKFNGDRSDRCNYAAATVSVRNLRFSTGMGLLDQRPLAPLWTVRYFDLSPALSCHSRRQVRWHN